MFKIHIYIISFTLLHVSQLYSQALNINYSFKDSIIKKGFNISQKISFTEDYEAVLKYDDHNLIHNFSKQDSITFLSFKSKDANLRIIEEANKTTAVFFNESHNIGFNRLFVLNLLDDLYRIGYRYLFLEALNNRDIDTNLNIRKYPITSTGHYIGEPIYGEFVRKALELGFKVLPYEDTNKITNYIYEDGYLITNKGYGLEREIMMALNIINQIKNDKKAKIIVYAGYGHIHEKGTNMGYYFKQFTNINPLTIDQTFMREQKNKNNENSYYKLVNVAKPSVFIDSNNNIFVEKLLKEDIDIQIFYPRTKYINTRASWMKFGNRKDYYLPKNELKVTFPCKVLAYYSNEYKEHGSKAIPIDIIELSNKTEHKPLFIPKKTNVTIIIYDVENTIKKIEINI